MRGKPVCGGRPILTSVLSNSCASFSPSEAVPSLPFTAFAFSASTTLDGVHTRKRELCSFSTTKKVVLRDATYSNNRGVCSPS